MMPRYYVDDDRRRRGPARVHDESCILIKTKSIDLGVYSWASGAVEKAAEYKEDAQRCQVCCPVSTGKKKARPSKLDRLERRRREASAKRLNELNQSLDMVGIARRLCELLQELEAAMATKKRKPSKAPVRPISGGIRLHGRVDALELAIASIGLTLDHLRSDGDLAKEEVLKWVRSRRESEAATVVADIWARSAADQASLDDAIND